MHQELDLPFHRLSHLLMKVLVIGSFAPSVVNFRGHLLKLLSSSGHRVHILCPEITKYPNVTGYLDSISVSYSAIPLSRSLFSPFVDLLSFLFICRQLFFFRYQCILAYTAKPVIFSGFAVVLTRLFFPHFTFKYYPFITGLGYAFTYKSKNFKRLLSHSLISYLYRFSLKSASTVIFQNPDDQSLFLSKHIVSSSTQTFRSYGSGVDIDYYSPSDLPNAHIFLMLSRLVSDKGVREYVQAARIVSELYPFVSFRLAGMLDHNPTAIKQSELDVWISNKYIEYLGDLNDVRGAIASSRYFVLPSYREGTPRSVLEAMSMARPIITTDAPGCRETVVHGHNGLLVKPADVPSLVSAMVQLIDASSEKIISMSHASRNIAVKYYDIRKVSTSLLNILSS